MIGFSFYKALESANQYNTQVENSNSYIDSLTIKDLFHQRQKEKLFDLAHIMSKKYNVGNPITENDTVTSFDRTFSGKKDELFVTDTLQRLWSDFTVSSFEIKLLNKKIDMTNDHLKTASSDYDELNYFYFSLAVLGLLLLIGGYAGMEKNQELQEKLVLLEISQKDQKYKYCQSCGKKFSSVITHGQNANGEVNTAFCFNCFDKGKFTEPDLSLEDFKKRTNKTLDLKKEKSERKELQKRFENLERWKIDQY